MQVLLVYEMAFQNFFQFGSASAMAWVPRASCAAPTAGSPFLRAIMAGGTLSAVPLLLVFLVANRRIIEGVRVSGLKG